jgi:hypothetical protein
MVLLISVILKHQKFGGGMQLRHQENMKKEKFLMAGSFNPWFLNTRT